MTISMTTDANGHFTIIDQLPATDVSIEVRASIQGDADATTTGIWFASTILAQEGAILDLGELQLDEDTQR